VPGVFFTLRPNSSRLADRDAIALEICRSVFSSTRPFFIFLNLRNHPVVSSEHESVFIRQIARWNLLFTSRTTFPYPRMEDNETDSDENSEWDQESTARTLTHSSM